MKGQISTALLNLLQLKYLAILILISWSFVSQSQSLQNRYLAWYLPSSNSRINGLGIGLVLNKLEKPPLIVTTVVNGVSIEIIGYGAVIPMMGGDPVTNKPDSFYLDSANIESELNNFNYPNYIINGITISPGGTNTTDANINGINISGIATATGKMNGVSMSLLYNGSGIVNGVSIGIIGNNTIQSNGLQIGLFTTTKRLRGIQIGLWNKNEKRSLPIFNWNFRSKSVTDQM